MDSWIAKSAYHPARLRSIYPFFGMYLVEYSPLNYYAPVEGLLCSESDILSTVRSLNEPA